MDDKNLATPTNVMHKQTVKGWIIIAIAAALSLGLYQILPYDVAANKGLALLTFIAILWLTEAVLVKPRRTLLSENFHTPMDSLGSSQKTENKAR